MEQRGRAYRRHQDRLAKRRTFKKLRRVWGNWKLPDAKVVGINAAVHCKPCSNAWCCGNARTLSGDTWQERDSKLSEKEQLKDIGG